MGQSSSSGRRRQEYHQDQNLPYNGQIASSSSYPPPPPPIPSGSSHPPPPGYAYSANAPYPSPYRPYTPLPQPPFNASYYQQSSSGNGSLLRILDSLMGRSPYPPPYYGPQQGGPYYGPHQGGPYYGSHQHQGGRSWVPSPSPPMAGLPPPPPPYVEHQNAKTVKNDVNLHKDTINLLPDEQNPDHHLVSFIFDALVDGSITVHYFAKEGANCHFSPIYPDMYTPMRVPFQKGLGQKFLQPSGSGFDLGFFDLDDLSKPMEGDVFPLVIFAEASPTPWPTDEQVGQSAIAANAQITQAVIEKNNNGSFQVKVVKQILWVDNERYELQEIFGLANSSNTEVNGGDDDDMGKECVICLSEPRDTAVLPCRHLCMCSDCAKALRLQSNKCPICRQPVEKLMEIKVDGAKQST